MTPPSPGQPPTDGLCPCGHDSAEHDALAARYCRATVLGALDRGCMCHPVSMRFSYDGVAR